MQYKQMRLLTFIGCGLLVLLLAACDANGSSTGASSTSTVVTAGKAVIKSIMTATLGGNFRNPQDSTPDLTGKTTYFTATASDGKAQGVYQVPAAGGTATDVYIGEPFVTPRSLVLSLDGRQLYMTDPGALQGGAIFSLSLDGGAPELVSGSLGTAPQNLDVVSQNGQQVIYFTGKDPSSGEPAVLKLAEGTDTPSVVIKGFPLVAPDGIVVNHLGDMMVSDRLAAGGGLGRIFKVEGHSATTMVEKVHTGEPAGIALSADESTVLVSAHQLTSLADEVLAVDVNTLQAGPITNQVGDVVGQNHSAAGLHESHGVKGVYSWADLTAGGGGGRVYSIE